MLWRQISTGILIWSHQRAWKASTMGNLHARNSNVTMKEKANKLWYAIAS